MRVTIAGTAAAVLVVLTGPALSQDRKACADAKDQAQAIRICSEVIRANPKDDAAFHLRGNALARNGDLGQAIGDYSKAIELNPNFAQAYDSRAIAYTTKGDFTQALADATKATELAKMGREAKAKTPVKARPRTSAWTPKLDAQPKQEVPTFNPFHDRSAY